MHVLRVFFGSIPAGRLWVIRDSRNMGDLWAPGGSGVIVVASPTSAALPYDRLSALIGTARVIEMIFTARLFSATDAHAAGLVTEVLPDQQMLEARARELPTLLAGHAPLTMRATREAWRRLRDSLPPDEDLIRLCYTSQDFKEGMDAVLTKRRPMASTWWCDPVTRPRSAVEPPTHVHRPARYW
jgi:hypothetical protein